MVQGPKVYMVGYGPRVNGFMPGSSSGKSLVSRLEYKGFMEIPSGCAILVLLGFCLSTALAKAAHSDEGAVVDRCRCQISLEPEDLSAASGDVVKAKKAEFSPQHDGTWNTPNKN